jgi:excinuclease UvrABC helicase subunit UvrB
MSDIFGKIRNGAGKVAFEADKVTHVKRIELDIGQLKRQVEGHYQKLGEITYRTLVARA